jgi:hypothetical protein
MMTTYYKAVKKHLNSKPCDFVEISNKYQFDRSADWYESLYFYNEDQVKRCKEKDSIAGISNLVTSRLYFDFDSVDNLEAAREDALTLAARLVDKYNLAEEQISVFFSGKKGYALELIADRYYTKSEYEAITDKLSEGLATYDRLVDEVRVIRAVNTKHQDSGLYKIPLTLDELETKTSEQIKVLAKQPRQLNVKPKKVTFDPSFFVVKKEQTNKVAPHTNIKDLDFTRKVKGWSNCKWALTKGYQVEPEGRNDKLLCIVAQAKALHYTPEQAYQTAKEADRAGTQAYNENHPDNEGERVNKAKLWATVEHVYSNVWRGGTYSCRDGKTPWLTSLCNSLGVHKCKQEVVDETPIKFEDLSKDFKVYVKNIDQNTILTGLPSLDKYVFLSTGANVGIIGAAGSGKTSIGLEILNNTSKAGVRSVVASLDMARNRIFEKIMYRLTGLSRTELYSVFKEDQEEPLMNKLREEFGNVNFFKRSCPTVQDIKEYVLKCNEQGPKVKLVVIDYFERITSDFSDDTAASKKIAGELQDLVDELDVCLITLVQPNKNAISGGPDQPIYDYTKIKGSSFVYQAFRIIISCWRPFYNPKDFSDDRFMQMAVLKNDLGELNELSFKWEGKQGFIKELEYEDQEELNQLLKTKEMKNSKDGLF